MANVLTRLAAVSALAVAASAAAQPAPAPPPTPGPAQDLMNPLGTPMGMEAGNTTADPQGFDLSYKKAREAADDRAASKGRTARTAAASASDIIAGSGVQDVRGKPVGTVESVAADGAVVATAAGKVMVPLEAFGKNKKGLMLGITKAEFDAAVAGAVGAK